MNKFETYQQRSKEWVLKCLGIKQFKNKKERRRRFLEEALELVQSLKMRKDEAHQLVEYVFNREKGEPSQEIGGTVNTLVIMCEAYNYNMIDCAEKELSRISNSETMKKIKIKQSKKPRFNRIVINRDSYYGEIIEDLFTLEKEIPNFKLGDNKNLLNAKRYRALSVSKEAIRLCVENGLFTNEYPNPLSNHKED